MKANPGALFARANPHVIHQMATPLHPAALPTPAEAA
jgi:hypothetical protein